MFITARTRRMLHRVAASVCGLAMLPCGCGLPITPEQEKPVTVSLINVTPFDVSATVSGVLDASVDSVDRTIGPSDSTDFTFVCVGQVVVGDPLSPDAPGLIVLANGGDETVAPFSIDAGASFVCGDVIEVIVSGDEDGPFLVDVFTFTPPCE